MSWSKIEATESIFIDEKALPKLLFVFILAINGILIKRRIEILRYKTVTIHLFCDGIQ